MYLLHNESCDSVYLLHNESCDSVYLLHNESHVILCVPVYNDNVPFSSFQEPPSDILIAHQLPISHPVPAYPSRHWHSFGCMQYPPIVAANKPYVVIKFVT